MHKLQTSIIVLDSCCIYVSAIVCWCVWWVASWLAIILSIALCIAQYLCMNIKNLTTKINAHTCSYVYLRFMLFLFTSELVCAPVRGPLTWVEGLLLGSIQLGAMDLVLSSRPGRGQVWGPIPKRDHAYPTPSHHTALGHILSLGIHTTVS